ncbi:hypothetical protein BDV30DRAFT_245189 [Aspergillus minisclerotigenes]|uniref:Uncharacterized protein n=1 Tax=Aspergillus minisclerotigenes TaxID=656917 RepID=A0A5N6IIB3_9EURO|nr:hypothetical protein BDV30DRAFT_245189 [Aspergillus minisclerotigenes]
MSIEANEGLHVLPGAGMTKSTTSSICPLAIVFEPAFNIVNPCVVNDAVAVPTHVIEHGHAEARLAVNDEILVVAPFSG